jgi:hypothetical protein
MYNCCQRFSFDNDNLTEPQAIFTAKKLRTVTLHISFPANEKAG